MTTIAVGRRQVGPDQPCFLAAEIGINHNGDLDLAHRSIDAAAEAGADAVKFQNYRTEDFLSDRALTYEYTSGGQRVVESQFDMFKRCELSPTALVDLRKHCDDRGVEFFSTPTSSSGVAELVAAGATLVKNGSDFLPHLQLIRSMAESGLPTVLSTGMATVAEVDDAVRAFRGAGGTDLLLLHCTSSYPTPDSDVNLRRIPVLAATFGCPVGFSDHTDGIVAALGARVLGACFIEKHFTIDKALPGPDHRFSADPAEWRELVNGVRRMEANLGDGQIGPTQSEAIGRRNFRVSCVAVRDFPSGHRLTQDDVVFRRPASGLPPSAAEWIIGRTLAATIKAGEAFRPEHFP